MVAALIGLDEAHTLMAMAGSSRPESDWICSDPYGARVGLCQCLRETWLHRRMYVRAGSILHR